MVTGKGCMCMAIKGGVGGSCAMEIRRRQCDVLTIRVAGVGSDDWRCIRRKTLMMEKNSKELKRSLKTT